MDIMTLPDFPQPLDTDCSKHRYVLDPGHGGIKDGVYQTPGKRSPKWDDGSQLFEGEFNRYLTALIAQQLQELQIDFCYTVAPNNPVDVTLGSRSGFFNELYRADTRHVFWSNHANAGGGTGFEVYTFPGESYSDELATILAESFRAYFPDLPLRADHTDGDVDKEAHFAVLKHTAGPAILAENLFMDTYDPDFLILNSIEGRQKLADMHVNAIRKIEGV
jgi:N-acetylmuramoyl-L-alanine amidase